MRELALRHQTGTKVAEEYGNKCREICSLNKFWGRATITPTFFLRSVLTLALQKITRASITVYSFDGLKEAASMYTRNPTLDVLVGKFICEFPITPEQRRYLNKSVRKRLTVEVPQ